MKNYIRSGRPLNTQWETDEAIQAISDVLRNGSYSLLPQKPSEIDKPDKTFQNNDELWSFILSNNCYFNQYIKISNFIFTEWAPKSPGLYFTEDARMLRSKVAKWVLDEEIANMIRSSNNLPSKPINEFPPDQKESMVKSGLGSIRLEPNTINNQEIYFWGATSSGISHEGIPIIVEADTYKSNIELLKVNCGAKANIVGRLIYLPEYITAIDFKPLIPRYCLWVEELEVLSIPNTEDISISLSINYTTSRELEKLYFSFVTFNPDNKEKNLIEAAHRLEDYAKRYSNTPKPVIIGDFDSTRKYFEDVLISIKELQSGNFHPEILSHFLKIRKFSIMSIENNYNLNNSQAGAVGPNSSSTGNTFTQINQPNPQLETVPPSTLPLKKWYDQHWIKSIGKSFLLSSAFGILLYILNISNLIHFSRIWEMSIVVFCIGAIYFINRDPKYTFYRGGLYIVTLLGVINVLPFLAGQFKWAHSNPYGNFDFIFKIGVQDNWLVSLGLLTIALYLFYKQPNS